MSELKFLIEAAARLHEEEEPFLLATVVCVRGSSYRRPGARMLLTRDRWVAGSVSGGCLEGDVLKKGWWRTEAGPVLLTYDSTSPDDVRWGFGLGCDGVVEVLLERSGPPATPAKPARIDPLAFLGLCHRTQQRGALATIFRSDVPDAHVGDRVALLPGAQGESDVLPGPLRERLLFDARAVLLKGESMVCSYPGEGGTVEAFIEAVLPPAQLFVFGAGHDAVAVVQMAHAVGWETIVCEPHARWATRERFAWADEVLFAPPAQAAARVEKSDRAMAIVMGHSYEQDRDYLNMLLGTRARYIGVLGPRRRTARMLGEVGQTLALGDPRVHAPVGLAIGAETPQEIALSIIAEVQAALTQTPAPSLRDLRGRIHQDPKNGEGLGPTALLAG